MKPLTARGQWISDTRRVNVDGFRGKVGTARNSTDGWHTCAELVYVEEPFSESRVNIQVM